MSNFEWSTVKRRYISKDPQLDAVAEMLAEKGFGQDEQQRILENMEQMTSNSKQLPPGPKIGGLIKDPSKAATNPITVTKSSGGSTDYYKLPVDAVELQDLIEYKDMDFALGNIFKACWRLGQKNGTSYEYDVRKIIWYAIRKLAKHTGTYYKLVPCSKEEFHESVS